MKSSFLIHCHHVYLILILLFNSLSSINCSDYFLSHSLNLDCSSHGILSQSLNSLFYCDCDNHWTGKADLINREGLDCLINITAMQVLYSLWLIVAFMCLSISLFHLTCLSCKYSKKSSYSIPLNPASSTSVNRNNNHNNTNNNNNNNNNNHNNNPPLVGVIIKSIRDNRANSSASVSLSNSESINGPNHQMKQSLIGQNIPNDNNKNNYTTYSNDDIENNMNNNNNSINNNNNNNNNNNHDNDNHNNSIDNQNPLNSQLVETNDNNITTNNQDDNNNNSYEIKHNNEKQFNHQHNKNMETAGISSFKSPNNVNYANQKELLSPTNDEQKSAQLVSFNANLSHNSHPKYHHQIWDIRSHSNNSRPKVTALQANSPNHMNDAHTNINSSSASHDKSIKSLFTQIEFTYPLLAFLFGTFSSTDCLLHLTANHLLGVNLDISIIYALSQCCFQTVSHLFLYNHAKLSSQMLRLTGKAQSTLQKKIFIIKWGLIISALFCCSTQACLILLVYYQQYNQEICMAYWLGMFCSTVTFFSVGRTYSTSFNSLISMDSSTLSEKQKLDRQAVVKRLKLLSRSGTISSVIGGLVSVAFALIPYLTARSSYAFPCLNLLITTAVISRVLSFKRVRESHQGKNKPLIVESNNHPHHGKILPKLLPNTLNTQRTSNAYLATSSSLEKPTKNNQILPVNHQVTNTNMDNNTS